MRLSINFYSETEKKAFYLHLIYSVLDGIILGVLALNEFVLIKELKASPYQIGILFQFTTVVLLFSIPFNEFIKRKINKSKFLRLIAILTRAPLLLLFIFPKSISAQTDQLLYQFLFLGIFLIYYSTNPLIFPMINGYLKNSYKHENFSKLYGYASTANKIIMLAATFSFGLLLDFKSYSYTFIYPFLAILGIASIYILTQIKYQAPVVQKTGSILISLKKVQKNLIYIIKTNKPFRDFEIGFMFYGFAWLVSIAVIAMFLKNKLNLSYSGIAFYKNFYTTVSIILTPFFGKLMGKVSPRKFAVYTFLMMLFYLLFMGLTQFFPAYVEIFNIKIYWSLLISFLSYGIFGAMMGILWYIGSAYFSKDKDAADYQSIHLSLTGFRGVFAPLVGIFFYEYFDYSGVFLIGIFSLLIAISSQIISLRRHK
ncbi:MAG: MFS transporter [Bacteroidales bacterium]|nr:MFS transporter [Bacteroidales bacterium]